ncbi:MAG: sensor histidine kinase [Chloroflexi bacterium]|nr:sensor histidine kinase [Chloroflexota bacterium]
MRPLPRVRGLQGNLTLSYTYITAMALLIAEVVGLLVFQQWAPTRVFQAEPDVATMDRLASEAATHMQPIDHDGLEMWLADLQIPVLNFIDAEDWLQANLGRFPARDRQTLLVATMEDGVLAATPADSPYANVSDISRLPGRLDQSMFADVPIQPGGNAVSFRRRDASVMVVPIQRDDETLLGLLILITDLTTEPPSPLSVLLLIGGSLVLFAILAAGIGTVFGYFTARRLTHRLAHLVSATSAWGQGDFSPHIDDSGEDEIQQLAHHLTELASQLQALLARREDWAATETRHHLARELHDSVKQQVFAIRMHLSSAQILTANVPQEATEHITDARQLAGEAQGELTKIISILRSESDALFSLRTVKEFLERWAEETGIALEVTLPEAIQLGEVPAQHLHRIIQEALANIRKHSHASQASVLLKVEGDHRLTLVIHDNGQGFSVDRASAGFGLQSMRERSALLGGKLSIISGNDGTRIALSIPAQPTISRETHSTSIM